MVLTRKVLRFGNPLPLVKSIIDRVKDGEDLKVKCLFWKNVSDTSHMFYYLLDHPLYFKRVGLINLEPRTA